VDRDPEDAAQLRGTLPRHVALLGDAAHPMAPFKAQGANQALIDALNLGRLLYDSRLGDAAAEMGKAGDEDAEKPKQLRRRTRGGVAEAVAAYYDEMLPRAANKIRASRLAADLLHSDAARTRSFGVTRLHAARVASAALVENEA